jgi:hypothetical protein
MNKHNLLLDRAHNPKQLSSFIIFYFLFFIKVLFLLKPFHHAQRLNRPRLPKLVNKYPYLK